MADTTGRLLDQFGRPIRRRELLEEIAAPSTTGVRQIISGHPAQGMTPGRLGALLREAEAGEATAYLELAEEMEEKDLHYAGVLGVRKRAVRSLEIHVEPGGEAPLDEEAAVLVREVLEGDGVRDDLVDVLDAIGKGYSVTEILWKTEGRLWTVERLEWRDPRWFRLDRTDGRTVRLIDTAGELDLPAAKFVTHFARAKTGLPIRAGLARLACWGWMFKNFALKDWAIFAETYGHPIRLGKYGPEATPEDRQTLLRALRAIGSDMAAAIPRSMELSLEYASGATSSADMYENLVRYWDEQISKGVLGQVGTTDAIAGGHAVGRVHNDVREDIRDADAEQLAVTLRRDLAAPLTALNFGPSVAVPKISLHAPDEVDLSTLVTAVQTLVPLGLRVSAADMRERLGLQAPEDGDELLGGAPAPAPAPAPSIATAAAAAATPSSSIDDLVELLIAEGHAETAARPMMSRIADLVASAESLEALREQLRTVADEAPPEALVGLLARAGFAGEMAGLFGADVDDRARPVE